MLLYILEISVKRRQGLNFSEDVYRMLSRFMASTIRKYLLHLSIEIAL